MFPDVLAPRALAHASPKATVEPSTVVAGSGMEKRKRLEGALGDQSLGGGLDMR